MKIQFGNQYRFYDPSEAKTKKQELTNKGIDSAVEYRSSQGMMEVINFVVHTDEGGTKDLTNFRNRGCKEANLDSFM